MDTIKSECAITAGRLGGQAEVVWTWRTEAGCWVQEVRRSGGRAAKRFMSSVKEDMKSVGVKEERRRRGSRRKRVIG